MFKKKIFDDLTSKYNDHAYSGLMGFFMNQCHTDLEKYNFSENISKILEIGAGTAPHYKYIKHKYDEYGPNYYRFATHYTDDGGISRGIKRCREIWDFIQTDKPVKKQKRNDDENSNYRVKGLHK